MTVSQCYKELKQNAVNIRFIEYVHLCLKHDHKELYQTLKAKKVSVPKNSILVDGLKKVHEHSEQDNIMQNFFNYCLDDQASLFHQLTHLTKEQRDLKQKIAHIHRFGLDKKLIKKPLPI